MSATFGFSVKHDKDGWAVWLPHQCDGWDIVGEDGGWMGRGVDHAEAVAEFERFMAEAQTALDALREQREIDPWEATP